tara:strand:- start:646 stop:885 length:240 start_codon:yes stop_codon:yes gene_type:complete
MILYSEAQLDEAWQYDCKQRSFRDRHWISRNDYENLFVLYLESVVSGDRLIKLDIYIPREMLASIDDTIDLEMEGYTDD